MVRPPFFPVHMAEFRGDAPLPRPRGLRRVRHRRHQGEGPPRPPHRPHPRLPHRGRRPGPGLHARPPGARWTCRTVDAERPRAVRRRRPAPPRRPVHRGGVRRSCPTGGTPRPTTPSRWPARPGPAAGPVPPRPGPHRRRDRPDAGRARRTGGGVTGARGRRRGRGNGPGSGPTVDRGLRRRCVQGGHGPVHHRGDHRVGHRGRRAGRLHLPELRLPLDRPALRGRGPGPHLDQLAPHRPGRAASASTCWPTTRRTCAGASPSPVATSSTGSTGTRPRSPGRRSSRAAWPGSTAGWSWSTTPATTS